MCRVAPLFLMGLLFGPSWLEILGILIALLLRLTLNLLLLVVTVATALVGPVWATTVSTSLPPI